PQARRRGRDRRALGHTPVRRDHRGRQSRDPASGPGPGTRRGRAGAERGRRQRCQFGLHAPDRRALRECRAMSSTTVHHRHGGFLLAEYVTCLSGIVWREGLRFLHQRERFVSALVRPLVWLFIFAAGFRQVLGVSIIPPYETYILYEVYIAP